MHKFDTNVQELKYQTLREVARLDEQGRLYEGATEIPKKLAPGPGPTLRCCVYKERAVLAERVRMAMGGSRQNPNVIEVLDVACDDCPIGGYEVTGVCRGCVAHRCAEVCPKNAIRFEDRHAVIDKQKCVNCGRCAAACPYNAITNRRRPCENSCKINAISTDERGYARIDNGRCTSCGACVYQCPFGAIMDKSYILNVLDLLRLSRSNQSFKLYAVVAPSMSSQFGVALPKVISGIKELGFFHVVEAALGADMVALEESRILAEKGFLFSSCCPAFVEYVKQDFPDLAKYISPSLSPMAEIARVIKRTAPGARVVFIGPCTAKKREIQRPEVKSWIDGALTFEELQALFDAREIDLTALPDTPLDNASYFGRIFARAGGLSDAVKEALKEQEISFDLKPVMCDGLDTIRMALLKVRAGKLEGNFLEGMACQGGCIGGAGCLTHGPKDKNDVDRYGREALERTLLDAVKGIPGAE